MYWTFVYSHYELLNIQVVMIIEKEEVDHCHHQVVIVVNLTPLHMMPVFLHHLHIMHL